jgi:hypothetical protein
MCTYGLNVNLKFSIAIFRYNDIMHLILINLIKNYFL